MKATKFKILGVTAILASLLVPSIANAATLNVDQNDAGCDDVAGTPYCTIQAAVTAAASGDTINIASGLYSENVVATSKGLTLVGEDVETTIIDGGNTSYVVFFDSASSEDVSLQNLTLRNGQEVNGGGFFMNQGNVGIDNCEIINNEATTGVGGGIALATGTLNISNSNIAYNVATTGAAGGIYFANGTLNINDSTINYNEAPTGAGIYHTMGESNITNSEISFNDAGTGAIGGMGHGTGTLTITNSQINDNEAGIVGGLYKSNDDLVMESSEVNNNFANASDTGGMYLIGGISTITNSTIDGNEAVGESGAILHEGAELNIINSTVSNNVSQEDAGGIHSTVGIVNIVNSTFSGNKAYRHVGALYTEGVTEISNSTIVNNVADFNNDGSGDAAGVGTSSTMTIRNSILALNEDMGGEYMDCYGNLASDGYNILGDDTGCTFANTTGDQVGTSGSPIDPMIETLADNGGKTLTHAIQLDSPALDPANPPGCEDETATVLTTDQRGFTRPVDGDDDSTETCDIGAYEAGTCGDGYIDEGEECDDGNSDDSDSCTNQCLVADCGDGSLEAGEEQCDDGNTEDGDGCDSFCQVEVEESGSAEETGTEEVAEDASEAESEGSGGGGCSLMAGTAGKAPASFNLVLALVGFLIVARLKQRVRL